MDRAAPSAMTIETTVRSEERSWQRSSSSMRAGINRFKSVAHEISTIDGGFWMPQTADFEATANFTPGALRLPASDPESFFGALTKAGRARRIIFVGHGSTSEIGLKGAAFIFDKAIGVDELNKWHTTIQSKIKPLTKGKVFDLITCNAGAGTQFPQQLAIGARRHRPRLQRCAHVAR